MPRTVGSKNRTAEEIKADAEIALLKAKLKVAEQKRKDQKAKIQTAKA